MKGIKASKPAPILIPCEGSLCPPAGALWICQMCGKTVPFDGRNLAVVHQRKDVLAMIERGDFG